MEASLSRRWFHDNEEVFSRAYDEVRLRGLSPKTVESYLGRLKLFLKYQLIHRRREHWEFPELMSKKELAHFFSSMDNLRDRAMFETIYGAGLRLSEITRLRAYDIDSQQMRIFVHHGKGGKDRFTLLSRRNLEVLREYWREYRPNHPDGYLFYPRKQN